MTVIAGIDVGNAPTEIVLMSSGKILGAGRVPTRGRKGSAGSLRGAAALVRRLERQLGRAVGEARIAPLRPVDTSVVTVPDAAVSAGRLPGGLPVIDQVDADTAAVCQLLAVEVRPPGHSLRLLADPVALGARLGLRGRAVLVASLSQAGPEQAAPVLSELLDVPV